MKYNAFALLTGFLYCFLMAVILFASLKRSRFSYLILFYEYSYIIGLGIFPIVASLDLVDVPPAFAAYESALNGLSVTTFIHVVMYAFGGFFGYFGLKPLATEIGQRVIGLAKICQFDNFKWFYFSSIFSICANLLYLSLVGLDVALLTAGAVRGGDFSGLIGLERYGFIKTLAMIGLFSVISLPALIRSKRLLSSSLILVVMAVLLYMQSVARVIFFDTVFFVAILYYALSPGKRSSAVILVFASALFLLLVAMYGKEFVGMFSMFLFSGERFELVENYDNLFSYLFSLFAHMIYSADAGGDHFFSHGPILPNDILLAPLGVFPSFVFVDSGLDYLSYQLVDNNDRLSCINTAYFVLADECSVPPYVVGFSAYLFPVVGGFVFGCLRFLIYQILEACWMRLRETPESLWIVLASLLIWNRLFLFIPNTISFAVFSLLILSFFILAQRVKLRLVNV